LCSLSPRIIASTHADIEDARRAPADPFHRPGGAAARPASSERPDVLPLANTRVAPGASAQTCRWSPGCGSALRDRAWPGNVREATSCGA
jgi:DNA-binding NtrC family response regulator